MFKIIQTLKINEMMCETKIITTLLKLMAIKINIMKKRIKF